MPRGRQYVRSKSSAPTASHAGDDIPPADITITTTTSDRIADGVQVDDVFAVVKAEVTKEVIKDLSPKIPVTAYLIPANSLSNGFALHSTNNFDLPIIGNIKHMLNVHKSQLDKIPAHKFTKFARKLDPYADKTQFKVKFGSKHVTNAWLKIDQLITWLSSINCLPTTINAFCNAEFPGAFILGIDNYCKRYDVPFDGRASSIIDSKFAGCDRGNNDENYLHDEYGLYTDHPEKWFMHKGNNGDVVISDNLYDIRRQVINSGVVVNFYTSDLGFFTDDYNRQEEVHSHAHYGACLCGLMTLASVSDSVMILKMFTLFTDVSISIVAYLSTKFDKLYIVKPDASRQLNSECYIVGIGYQGISETEISKLMTVLRDFEHKPIVAKTKIKSAFIDQFTMIINKMAISQRNMIDLIANMKR
jgi:23S rRNA U2552 (ribose-2'-O)-methylase RlmE/FtsJ